MGGFFDGEGVSGRTLDEVLGASRGRYLAHGFARVRRRLTECRVEPRDGGLLVTADAVAAYPGDWSVKGGTSQQAHLSSIDALLFADELAAAVFDPEAVGRAGDEGAGRGRAPRAGSCDGARPSLRSADLRAGTSAQTELERVRATCSLRAEEGEERVRARCEIGSMRAELVLEVGPGRWRALLGEVGAPIELGDRAVVTEPDEWESRFLRLDVAGRWVTARHRAAGDVAPGPRPPMTILDLLRLSAQQAQALIYAVDEVDRSSAENLWMRRARFTAEPVAHAGRGVDMRLRIDREMTLPRDGGAWRRFEVVADGVPGMTAGASLVYRA